MNQTLSKLKEVIREFEGGPGDSAEVTSTRVKEADADRDKDKEKDNRKLFTEPWGKARVVNAAGLRAALEDKTTPLVVLAAGAAEQGGCERQRLAFGSRTDVTYVVLNTDGPDDVLLAGEGGPEKAKAKVIYVGEGSPKQLRLDTAMKDDTPMQHARAKLRTFRVTVARDFADPVLFSKAEAEPHATAALVMGAGPSERSPHTRRDLVPGRGDLHHLRPGRRQGWLPNGGP